MTLRIPALAALATTLLLSACTGGSASGESSVTEPPLETDVAKLEAGLSCTEFTHPDKPAVLLVHGTFTAGFEQYDWTYKPLLVARGYDVCTVTYPDRGLGDAQISAEYVVHALRQMRARSGRKVAMIGHSQGVAVPRWAIKWWPSARDAVDDFVMQAGPNHGGDPVGLFTLLRPILPGASSAAPVLPEALYQMVGNSAFIQATNAGDETPGDISYSAMYTLFDELVQPVNPVPTAAVDWQQDNPKVANILLQDVCPGRIVDHVTIGLIDRLAFELALDAIGHPGPANVERVLEAAGGQSALCGLLPILPSLEIAPLPQLLLGLLGILPQDAAAGLPQLHLSTGEPELKPYAR
ncbi:esterase/lipase family protein [Solimonas sp. K1W22B-7]|uniref:esterase/lipase family protein n=1 Tax=Solimonas sp. K1W22B-7 TaxID=2303331 RepID=UPI001968D65D|nr:alpha/beta fold hydrolase [Solimonas sp. K1W22B-7]